MRKVFGWFGKEPPTHLVGWAQVAGVPIGVIGIVVAILLAIIVGGNDSPATSRTETLPSVAGPTGAPTTSTSPRTAPQPVAEPGPPRDVTSPCSTARGPRRTLLAGVPGSGIGVTAYVRLRRAPFWTQAVTARKGDTVDVLVAVRNQLRAEQPAAAAEIDLASLRYVKGTTVLRSDAYPHGLALESAAIPGIVGIGDYRGKGTGFLCFSVVFDPESAYSLGEIDVHVTSATTESNYSTAKVSG